jgi:hypothetical protein
LSKKRSIARLIVERIHRRFGLHESERINARWLTRFRGFHFRVSGLGAETGWLRRPEAPKRIPYGRRRG